MIMKIENCILNIKVNPGLCLISLFTALLNHNKI
jgi:hypothetical protein